MAHAGHLCLAQENFSVYDLDSVMRAMNILADDLEMVVNMEKTFGARINSAMTSTVPYHTILFCWGPTYTVAVRGFEMLPRDSQSDRKKS